MFAMFVLKVNSFDEVEKDQVLCVSTGRTFRQPPVTRQDVEVKANWSRARKQYGPSATDYKVDTAQNPQVNVSYHLFKTLPEAKV